MKNYLKYLAVITFIIHYFIYSFQIDLRQSDLNQGVTANNQKEIEQTKKSLIIIAQVLDSIKQERIINKKIIDDLHRDIVASDKTLTRQNMFINAFEVIYAILTILISIAAIAIPFVTFRALNDAEKRIDVKLVSLEGKIEKDFLKLTDQLDQKVGASLIKHNRIIISQALENLKIPDSNIQSYAIRYITEFLYFQDFSETQLWELKLILQNNIFLSDDLIGMVKKIYESPLGGFTDDFFLNVYKYSHLSKIRSVRYYTSKYLLNNGNILGSVNALSHLILSTKDPTNELLVVIGWMSSDKEEIKLILPLLDYKTFIDSKNIVKKEVKIKLNEPIFDTERSQIKKTYLFKSKTNI